MQYFFIPGTHPLLSVAEIISFFGSDRSGNISNIKCTKNTDAITFDFEKKLELGEMIKKLGGTVKSGEVKSKVESRKSKVEMQDKIMEMIEAKVMKQGKFNFGISVYGTDSINIKHLGLTLKNRLKEKGVSCRWVVSKEKNLSSVVVDTNHLTDKGMEIVLIKQGDNIFIGYTLAVQPFRELSYRDYGRPARDDHSGMLPPKLAQIMINLSGAMPGDTILDPFCGSGTIITEAMLMGYQKVIGSDISKKAVEDTKRNMEWIKEKYEVGSMKYEVRNMDVLELRTHYAPDSFNAIITEPYLGPQRGNVSIYKTKKELEALYSKSLEIFDKLLRPGGKIVMVWPIFIKNGNQITLDLNTEKYFQSVNYLPHGLMEALKQDVKIKKQFTLRNNPVYGRPGQKVWREVVVLTKK